MMNVYQGSRFDHDENYSSQLGAFMVAAQSSPMPTMIVDSLVPSITIVFVNDALLDMTGFDRSDLLGNSIYKIFGELADQKTISLLGTGVASGKAGQWQVSVERANKSTFLAITYLSPVFDNKGNVKNHVVNFFDVTSMLCMSREKKEIYPAVYDKAPGFIAICNGENFKYTYANAAYKAFVKRDALIGKTVAEVTPEVVVQGIVTILDEVYHTGIPFRGKDMPITILDTEKGRIEQHWVDVVYQPIRNDSGAIIGLFCEGYDVTDLHEANESLVALNIKLSHLSRINAMGTMAATLAHELNQPLTAISNYLGGVRPLGGPAPNIDRLTEALEGIKEASERAAKTIDHVRQLTKHRPPNREPFNLKEALDDCIRLVRSGCGADVVFKNCVTADMVMNADHVKIQQVLINLLQNACDAMTNTANPVVSISAGMDGRHLTVCIADNGSGVSLEAASAMFAWMESTKADGMGIGLSICRTIVELHRGKIWLEKTGPGGSEFRFSLPAEFVI